MSDHSRFQAVGDDNSSVTTTDVMQLEHVMGYTGANAATLQFHSAPGSNTLIYNMGSVLVLEDPDDPHRQEFLRGHDGDISCIVVSPSGELIASGQRGSAVKAGNRASVIVWDYASRLSIYVLEGFTDKVSHICFSPDGAFLAAAGGPEGLVMVWEIRSGDLIITRKSPKGLVTALSWGSIVDPGSRRPKHKLIIGFGARIFQHLLEWDVKSVQYVTTTQEYALPSSGLVRTFTAAITSDNDELIIGTMAGEFCVFNNASKVYRANIPVSSNGVLSLCSRSGYIFAGAGDGSIKKYYGKDLSWVLDGEVVIQGRVISLSLRSDGRELIAGTDGGKIYRINAANMEASLHSQCPIASVNAIAFGRLNDLFGTVSSDGTLSVWDLGDYKVRMSAGYKKGGRCIIFTPDDDTIVSGWDDSFIRAHTISSSKPLFEIPNAHRGSVTAVAVTLLYICSGGDDGRVRIWNRKGRNEVLLEFAEHRRGISAVLADFNEPHLIHSTSIDRTVLTYDLIKERRVVIHMLKDSGCTTLSQRKDSENELVTGCNDGRIYYWDCDIPNPTVGIQDPSNQPLTAAKVSPSGRYLAVCGVDQLVKVYLVQDGSLVTAGHVHSQTVKDLAWSPDEKQIVSSSGDCGIAVWNFFGIE